MPIASPREANTRFLAFMSWREGEHVLHFYILFFTHDGLIVPPLKKIPAHLLLCLHLQFESSQVARLLKSTELAYVA